VKGDILSQDTARILQFPAAEAEEAVTALLRFIGEDPERDGLRDTPARVVKAWREMTAGYGEDPGEILSRTFAETSDEMVILRGISFYSTCEHHLLPFYGEAVVGYLPGKVVGISKLARLVECFAKRLQVQERMTRQIAEAVEKHLEARGVGVVLRAHHLCMGCRGVRQEETEMVTSSMLGTLRTDAASRAEFLRLCKQI
jgi:GTP cyclohydrolase I